MAKLRAETPSKVDTVPKDYESALAELEAIVANMESGQLSLEASLATYKRGVDLLNFCRQQLVDAEQQIQVLENGGLMPFRPGASDE